jgi:hypothetical protein
MRRLASRRYTHTFEPLRHEALRHGWKDLENNNWVHCHPSLSPYPARLTMPFTNE